MNRNFKCLDQTGMSLIEVMIIITAMSLISLGMASLFKNMTSIQTRTSTKTALYQIQANLEEALRNQRAWGLSVSESANNSTLGCLRDGNSCSDGSTPLSSNLRVLNAKGDIEFDGTSTTAGWNYNGLPCNSFSATGNDDCPFRYQLQVTTECPIGSSPCSNPMVTITGDLIFSPDNISDLRNRINTNNFQIRIERGIAQRYEPFELRFVDRDNNGDIGGGECEANDWRQRPLNDFQDLGGGDNVSINLTTAGVVALPGVTPPAGVGEFSLEPGTYECNVMAQAYDTEDGFQVRLRDMSDTVGPFYAGGAYTLQNQATFSMGTVKFRIQNQRTFRLEHYCRRDPSWVDYVDPHPTIPSMRPRTFHMGIPVAYYGTTNVHSVYTSISCVRSS